jgi:hypothetical protein
MNNRVSNGIFGKIIRTLGFVLLLVSSALIASQIVLANTSYSLIANLESYANMVEDATAQLGFAVDTYALLGLIVGLLLLTWSLRKGIILRLLITVSLVFVLAEAVDNANGLFAGAVLTAPVFLSDAVGYVSSYLDQLIAVSAYVVPGASLLAVLFLWGLFANKKPKRLSVNLVRVGMIFLLFAVIVAALPSMATATLFTASWYLIMGVVLYLLSYVFFILGSALGIIGFLRS